MDMVFHTMHIKSLRCGDAHSGASSIHLKSAALQTDDATEKYIRQAELHWSRSR